MERLTGKFRGRTGLVDYLNVSCNKICNRSFCEDCPIEKAFEKLAHYEDLEEQGLLLKLPCKVGDECYVPNATFKRVFEVYCISISKDKENIWVRCGNGLMYIWNEEIFATKAEAEKALEEMEK